MEAVRHNRVSSREEWDAMVAQVNVWATQMGRSAALWRSIDKYTVRFVAGADAMRPDRLWVCIYSQPAGEAAVPGHAEQVWSIYEGERARYERTIHLGVRRPGPREDDVKVLGVRDPFDPWAPPTSPTGRKKRSDAGVQKGPRHLQQARRGSASGGEE